MWVCLTFSGFTLLLWWGKRPLPLWCFKLCMWSLCCLVNGEREDDRGKEGWGGGRGGGGGWRVCNRTPALSVFSFSSLPLSSPLSCALSVKSALWALRWNSSIFLLWCYYRILETGEKYDPAFLNLDQHRRKLLRGESLAKVWCVPVSKGRRFTCLHCLYHTVLFMQWSGSRRCREELVRSGLTGAESHQWELVKKKKRAASKLNLTVEESARWLGASPKSCVVLHQTSVSCFIFHSCAWWTILFKYTVTGYYAAASKMENMTLWTFFYFFVHLKRLKSLV